MYALAKYNHLKCHKQMPYMQSGSYPGLLKGLLNSTITGAGVWGQPPGIQYLNISIFNGYLI